MAIDKYTYFNDLQMADFYHILFSLEKKGIITINNNDDIDDVLKGILEDYVEEDEDTEC